MNTHGALSGLWIARAAIAAVLCSALLAPASVLAAEDDIDELAEVQVTGTRIQVPGNFTAANPITTLTGDDLKRLGIVNVSDALTTLVPQNLSNAQPINTGQGAFFVGQTLANLRGLNNVDAFGTTIGSRTLTLIDGRRVVSTSNMADVVDLNIIPSNLLQRMDVVTGGASAAYGSGAMAGVVNLVLNNRLEGINLDMDYGVNGAGDGSQRHIALSGGTAVFEGRGHFLAGGEWQKNDAIQGCGGRAWCEKSSNILANSANSFLAPGVSFTPLPGYEDQPFRFAATNLRFSQWSPNGVIATMNPNATSGYRFIQNPNGSIGAEEYALGLNGGSTNPAFSGTAVNGDGPPAFSFLTLTPASDRRTAFSRLEFEFTNSLTGYVEASYAKTGGVNRQLPNAGAYCVHFDTPGSSAQQGASFVSGSVVPYDGPLGTLNFFGTSTGIWANQDFLTFINYGPNVQNGSFGPDGFVLTAAFTAPSIPAVLPQLTDGSRANAFLGQLDAAALAQLQASFNNVPNTGNAAEQLAYGQTACAGSTAIYKVWNPQFEMVTKNSAETVRSVLGLKGRFGDSWRWESYYQYGKTRSRSLQTHATSTYKLAFALDSVLDAQGNPVCRVTRDGVEGLDIDTDGDGPIQAGDGLNTYGEPFDFAALRQLAEGCRPLNVFGPTADQAALDYAFIPQTSSGDTRLDVLSFNTSGTVWKGWAGPLTAAFGLEWRKDSVNNAGQRGAGAEIQDIAFNWPDAFGGHTKVLEEYAELNLPIVSNLPGVNLFSINGAVRHADYKNTGGVGTTGESGTQTTTNWKLSTVFEPFDWLRFRMTRSRDLRAAGYRELYQNQVGVADASSVTNPWRDSQQADRMGQNFGGNPALKPEKSDTQTVGFVMLPGGWAQGMRFSVDYTNIRVKDGLQQTFSPLQSCWEESGNVAPVMVNGVPDFTNAVNGRFDPDSKACQALQFSDVPHPSFPADDDNAPCLAGIGCLSNLKSVSSSYENALPFQIRALDIAWNYNFPLNRLFDGLPGGLALNVIGNRALEASGNSTSFFCPGEADYVGQLSGGLGCNAGIQPTPKWSGNFSVSYFVGNLMTTLSARYVGGAKIDKVWYADGPGQALVPAQPPPGSPPGTVVPPVDPYQNSSGNFLVGSIDNNTVPAYFNFSLNSSYNLPLSGVKQFQLFGSINNLFDRDPPLTGGFIAGGNPMFHDTMGRSYRLGVRVRF